MRIRILIGTTVVQIRILIGTTIVRIRILIGTTVVRIASVLSENKNSLVTGYNPPALLLPTALVNIIVIVVYFYPRLRIRYPEFILVVILMVSGARYKTLHSTSYRNLSERVGEVDTALSYEPEGRGFESRLVSFFFLHTFFVLFSGYCSNVQGNLET